MRADVSLQSKRGSYGGFWFIQRKLPMPGLEEDWTPDLVLEHIKAALYRYKTSGPNRTYGKYVKSCVWWLDNHRSTFVEIWNRTSSPEEKTNHRRTVVARTLQLVYTVLDDRLKNRNDNPKSPRGKSLEKILRQIYSTITQDTLRDELLPCDIEDFVRDFYNIGFHVLYPASRPSLSSPAAAWSPTLDGSF